MLAFLLLRLSGDPAIALAGEGARQADIEMIRQTYGFDRPLLVQYADWLWKIAARRSRQLGLFQDRGRPADRLDKLPATLLLGVVVAAVRAC